MYFEWTGRGQNLLACPHFLIVVDTPGKKTVGVSTVTMDQGYRRNQCGHARSKIQRRVHRRIHYGIEPSLNLKMKGYEQKHL